MISVCIVNDLIRMISGQPVAWCISDQETTEVIEVFLKSVHSKSPETNVTILMTDDGKHDKLIEWKLTNQSCQKITQAGMQQAVSSVQRSNTCSVIGMYIGEENV